jgi:hypothetical protein
MVSRKENDVTQTKRNAHPGMENKEKMQFGNEDDNEQPAQPRGHIKRLPPSPETSDDEKIEEGGVFDVRHMNRRCRKSRRIFC